MSDASADFGCVSVCARARARFLALLISGLGLPRTFSYGDVKYAVYVPPTPTILNNLMNRT
jgi:hypothetical protein